MAFDLPVIIGVNYYQDQYVKFVESTKRFSRYTFNVKFVPDIHLFPGLRKTRHLYKPV